MVATEMVVEFGEWLCQQVLTAVPHRHAVLSIPKILRRYFLYDRSLLSDLSRYDREALKAFYTNGPPINVFPAYNEQPEPCADDYTRDPDYPAALSRRSSKNEDGLVSA